MTYDIAEPYGPLITDGLRLVVWNVWGRHGPWQARERALTAVLRQQAPDIVVLVEAWRSAQDDQVRRLAAGLGLAHHVLGCEIPAGETSSGLAVLSAWPIAHHTERTLPSPHGTGPNNGEGGVLFTEIEGPRGPVQLFAVALAWRLDHSAVRQGQVRHLGAFIAEVQRKRSPVIVCGDFNADPSSDEIRMLTGRTDTSARALVFLDAWEVAGSDGPGHTWSNANGWARPVLWPDRRIDYVFSAHPRRGGAGHPTRCQVIGTEAIDGAVPSDHYGLVADLRY